MINFKTKHNYNTALLLSFLILITLGVVLFCQYPSLKNKLVHHCDIDLFFPPVYQLLNPKLFVNDFLTQYMLFQLPKGYLALFYCLGHFSDPIILAKILPFILSVISVIFLFMLGKNIEGDVAGFIMAYLFILHCWTFHVFQATTPRAFAYPLFLPLIYYLFKKQYLISFILCVVLILFYPPIAFVAFTILLVSFFHEKLYKRGIRFSVTCFVIFLFFILYILFLDIQENVLYGPMVSFKEMLEMPEFYSKGKEALFHYNIIQFMVSRNSGFNLNSSFIFIFALFAILFLVFMKTYKRPLKLKKELIYVCIASFILYIFAYLLLFGLYFPARYVIYTLPFVFCVLIGILFDKLYHLIRAKTFKRIMFISFLIISISFYSFQINGRLTDYSYLRNVVDFLSNVPEGSTVASTPFMSIPIHVFSKRKVLFSHRFLVPYQSAYYKKIKKRVYDFYNAYYSDSEENIRNFCAKYSIDYIMFKRDHFCKEYFDMIKGGAEGNEPFTSYILDLINKKKIFVLPKVDKKSIVFEKDGFVIIKTPGLRFANNDR